jgi:tetratricopeptide (TPR) repeat protein
MLRVQRQMNLRRISIKLLLLAMIPLLAPSAFAQEGESDVVNEHVLQAEMALQREDYLVAAREYVMAAKLSEDVEIASRATKISYSYGFDEDGLVAAKRWRELVPESDEALVYLAQIELRLGDIKDARQSFKELIERGSGEPDQTLVSPMVSILSRADAEDADEVMRWLAKPYPDSAHAHYAVAVLALQAGDSEEAEKRSMRAIELDPEWIRAKLLYARALLLSGKQEEAIDYTARIIGDDPNPHPDARMELAIMLMAAGRDDDALSQVNQILLEQASRIDAMRLMAIINFRQGNFDAAWDDFEDVLSSGEFRMDALYYLARIADIREEYGKAIRLYGEVRGGQNAVPSQRRVSALMAFQGGDAEGALAHLDDFASENANFAVDMVVAKAQLLASLERYPESMEVYDKAISYRPNDEGILLNRAELLLRMDKVDDAVAQYRAVVKRWPDSALALNALGYTLADRTDKYREAEKLIRKAIRYDPDNPAVIDSLGWVLFKRDKYEEALVELEIAYERFPDPEVAAHLIEVLAALDRESDALEILTASEARNPASERLEDVRNRLFSETP